MRTHFTYLAILLCAVNPVRADVAPEIGTLFYTPAQRQDIGRARQGLSGTSGLSDAADTAAAARLSGVVHRAGGKGTVWINDRPYAEGNSQGAKIKGVDAIVQGQRLRVGERIDKASGERTDLVAPGAITVRKPR